MLFGLFLQVCTHPSLHPLPYVLTSLVLEILCSLCTQCFGCCHISAEPRGRSPPSSHQQHSECSQRIVCCLWCWLMVTLGSTKTPKCFSVKLLSTWSPFLPAHRLRPQFPVLISRIFYLNKDKIGGLSIHCDF